MSVSEVKYDRLQAVLRRGGVRQFVKFCIVGASSTLIDFSIYLSLIELAHLQTHIGSVVWGRVAAQCVSFLFAVTNGFIWNNRWTFRHADTRGIRGRYAKFVITNIIGLSLNVVILNVVAHLAPPNLTSMLATHLKDPAGFIGKLAAIVVVVFWNFTVSKYWTFRK